MVSTKVVTIDILKPNPDCLKEAANIIKTGGLVIIPTETVYGIAADMLNRKAIDRLYEIKKRPRGAPFSLHIYNKETVADFATDVPIAAYKLMDKFWPGPLTMVLKAKDKGTIGIRLPDSTVAVWIISASGVPVVCPSANISGKPAPVNFQEAIKDLDGLVDFAIDAGSTKLQAESSVVDLTTTPLRILRESAVKKEDIENTVKKKTVLFVCTGNSCRSVMAEMLLEKKLKEKNRDDVEVLSAGIMILSGFGATQETKEVLARVGIDVSAHHSQRVTRDMINRSDIILVMEKLHEEKNLEIAPQAKNRVFLLRDFAKINNNLNIADPIGRSLEFYEQTLSIIKEAIEKIVQII